MARIALPAWEPDVAAVDAAVCSVATNIIPRKDGYAPIRSPVALSSALPSPCLGAIEVPSPAYGFPIYFAGTATGLFKFANGSWLNVSKPGATYSMPPGDYWSFAVYGTKLLATCLGTTVQVIDIDAGKVFADLGGNPPRARHMGVVSEFLVLAGLGSDPNAVHWSDLGDITYWEPGVQSGGHTSDLQIFPEGGPVTGFAGGEFGLVFQEGKIRRMVFSPGSVTVFDFSVLEENRGAVAPWSLIKVGARVFFLDREGFFLFTGGASTTIGAERVNRFFSARVDPIRVTSTVCIRDATGPRILFAYRTLAAPTNDPTLLNEVLIYDWLLDRWTFLDVPVRYGLVGATLAVSVDDIPGSLDDAGQKSLDDPSYAGGPPTLGLITADNKLSLLTGPPLEATMETPDAMLSRPSRSFVRGMRLDSDADDWRIQVGTRETLRQAEAVRWRDETAPNLERVAPCRASGRYHRARIRVPSGTAWSYVSGVEPDAVAEGGR